MSVLERRWVSVFCGAVAAFMGLLSAALSAPSLSGLVKIAASDPIRGFAEQRDPNFDFVTAAEHYDGVYYYAIAADPFARGQAHTLIDQAAYRYGHPLHGWTARLLSLGCDRWIPVALFVLSLVGLFLAGWAMSELAQARGANGWIGLVVAVSPGLLFAAGVDTTEPLGAALVLCAMLAWSRRRWGIAAALIVACCLDKEQFVTVPLGLAVWELVPVGWRFGHVENKRQKAVAVMLGPGVLSLWYVYVHARFARWPWQYEPGNLGAPGVGFARSFDDARRWAASGAFEKAQMGSIVVPVLLASLLIVIAGVMVSVRQRSIVAGPLVGMAVIFSCQGHLTLENPHEIFRTPAVSVLLAAFSLLCGRARKPDPA